MSFFNSLLAQTGAAYAMVEKFAQPQTASQTVAPANDAAAKASSTYATVVKFTHDKAIPQTAAAYAAVDKFAQPGIARAAALGGTMATNASAGYTTVEQFTHEKAIPQTIAAYTAVEQFAQRRISQTAAQTAALGDSVAAKARVAYALAHNNPHISRTAALALTRVSTVYGTAGKFVRENPHTSTAIAIGVGGVVVPMLVVPILGSAGFSAKGVVAGSVAASLQSMLGPVEAGSLFAFCQSAAMGGYGAAALSTISISSGIFVGTTAATVATVAAINARQQALKNNPGNSALDGV